MSATRLLYKVVSPRSQIWPMSSRPRDRTSGTRLQLLNFEHDPGYKHGWLIPTGERTATHPVVREKAQEMLDKEERDFGGVLSTAKTALTLYSDPLVPKNPPATNSPIEVLLNTNRPVSLYLAVNS